jgi:uncharacterized protein (TIGR02145 family)
LIFIKVLLTGLIGASLCMANISGIVTDTGAIPLANAVVRLGKGGPTAITGSDGRFSLDASTTVHPSSCNSFSNGLSVRLFGSTLKVAVSKRSAVEIGIFDLHGKFHYKTTRTLEIGTNSMTLPFLGTGLFLYKLTVDNRELIIKGNSIDRSASGSGIFSGNFHSPSMVKYAKAAYAINDVLTATNTGFLNYRMTIGNSDTSGIVIRMIPSAGTVTDTDGNVYQTTKIGTQVWMTENLRTTKYRDGTAIPLIKDNAAWFAFEKPEYCYYNNMTDADSIKLFGALYNAFAACSTIAPSGWHVASKSEWEIMVNFLIASGYNWDGTTSGIKIAKSLSTKTNWAGATVPGAIGNDLSANNATGFSAFPGGWRGYDGVFFNSGEDSYWWTSTKADALNSYFCNIEFNNYYLRSQENGNSAGCSIRCIRD